MKNYCFVILFFTVFFGCSSNDSGNNSKNLFVVNDFKATIDENPNQYQLIGTIPYDVGGSSDIKFFITSQNVSNAINIIEDDIFVSEPILFDFEINPIIIANVKIEKGYYYYYEWSVEDTKTITVTINLNDLPD